MISVRNAPTTATTFKFSELSSFLKALAVALVFTRVDDVVEEVVGEAVREVVRELTEEVAVKFVGDDLAVVVCPRVAVVVSPVLAVVLSVVVRVTVVVEARRPQAQQASFAGGLPVPSTSFSIRCSESAGTPSTQLPNFSN